jgi:hypothetical protein
MSHPVDPLTEKPQTERRGLRLYTGGKAAEESVG